MKSDHIADRASAGSAIAWALAAAMCASFPACGSNADAGSGLPASDAGACVVDAECDDGNPCTTDACGDGGACAAVPQADGDALVQEPGDCARTVCASGVPSSVVDRGDPADDRNDCTLDRCSGAVAVHEPKVDGTSCRVGRGSGTCLSGTCLVLCTPSSGDSQCDDDNPCTTDACLPCAAEECRGQGLCKHSAVTGGDPPPQIPGDCRRRRCVEGEEEDVADDADVPVDGQECTKDECRAGVPVNPPLALGARCSFGVCDGAGECVECNTRADCPDDLGDPCREPACEENRCTTTSVPAGTPLPATSQTAGDCRRLVCDGSGSFTQENDDADTADDGNDCTDDACSSGSRVHTPKAPGTTCGPGRICTASATCCAPTSCASQGRSCGTISDGCGSVLSCGSCSPGDSCTSSGVCRCANGVRDAGEAGVDCGGTCPTPCGTGTACSSPSQCTSGHCVDGFCCDGPCTGPCRSCRELRTGRPNGQCGNVLDGTDPEGECAATSPASCGTSGACRSGACEMHPAGTTCAAASCSGSTRFAPDTCDGAGQCVDGGSSACGGAYVCSGQDCQSCSDGLRNGSETAVDCGGGAPCAPCANGRACGAGSDCVSGQCVDGVCCDTTCTGTCRRCNLSGLAGTCTFIPNGQDPDDECPGNNNCNGMGGC